MNSTVVYIRVIVRRFFTSDQVYTLHIYNGCITFISFCGIKSYIFFRITFHKVR